MSVESWQLARVAEFAKQYAVLLHHCRDSRSCAGDSGLPDLVLVAVGGLLFRELKSSPRNVTSAQSSWLWGLRAAGANAGIWLPSHFRDGTVEREIKHIGGY